MWISEDNHQLIRASNRALAMVHFNVFLCVIYQYNFIKYLYLNQKCLCMELAMNLNFQKNYEHRGPFASCSPSLPFSFLWSFDLRSLHFKIIPGFCLSTFMMWL